MKFSLDSHLSLTTSDQRKVEGLPELMSSFHDYDKWNSRLGLEPLQNFED